MAEPAKPAGPAGVTGQQLAELFGVDVRSITEHANRGHVLKIGRNRYAFGESIQRYTKYLREQAQGRKGAEGLDAVSENALYTQEKRMALRDKQQRDAGMLMPVSLVEQVMVDHIKGLLGMILGISNTIQAEMPHIDAVDLKQIRDICEAVLKNNVVREIETTKMHPELRKYMDEKQGKARL